MFVYACNICFEQETQCPSGGRLWIFTSSLVLAIRGSVFSASVCLSLPLFLLSISGSRSLSLSSPTSAVRQKNRILGLMNVNQIHPKYWVWIHNGLLLGGHARTLLTPQHLGSFGYHRCGFGWGQPGNQVRFHIPAVWQTTEDTIYMES